MVLLVSGWFFIFLGILGLFLPVLQGILFLAIGAVLLSSVSPRARLFRLRAGQRWPVVRRSTDKASDWLRQRFSKKKRKTNQ